MNKCIAQVMYFNDAKASLKPLRLYDEQSNKWEPIITDDALERFPPKGVIFYPRPPHDADISHYLYVLCEYNENPKTLTEIGYDKMLAKSYTPLRLVYYPDVEQADDHPFETICASLSKILKTIRYEGIVSNELYINIEEDTYIKLIIDDGVLKIYRTPNDVKCVPTYFLDSDSFFDINDFSYTLNSDIRERKTRYILCDSDGEFIRFIAKKLTQEYSYIYTKTKKEIDEIRSVLHQLQADRKDILGYDVEQILAHLSRIIDNIVHTNDFITYADKIIRSSDAFKARCAAITHEEEGKIRDATEKKLQEIEIQQRQVIEKALQQENDKLEQLRQTIANLSSKHETALEQLRNTRLDREILHAALQEEREHIYTMLAAVAEGEMPHARTFAARLDEIKAASTYSRALPEPIAPWARPEVGHVFSRLPETKLEQRLKDEKLPVDAGESLFWMDGLLRAGEPVWLVGLGREWLLTRYAACVSGGHIYHMQADPSTLNVDDLWRLPGTREATALARAWAVATAMPDSTHVVALHVAGSPCHLWFPALGQALRNTKRPANLLLTLLPNNLPCPEESITDFLNFSESVFCPPVDSSGEYAFNMLNYQLPQPTMLAMNMEDAKPIRDTRLLSSPDPWQTRRGIAFARCFLLPAASSPCWPLEAEQLDCIQQGRENLREYAGRN